MQRLIAGLLAFLLCLGICLPEAMASTQEPRSGDQILMWIKAYRQKPQRKQVPALVRYLSANGAFQDPDSAGVYTGFIAGVIATGPGGKEAEKFVSAMLPLRDEDQWVLVRAIAYSGLPGWQTVLKHLAPRLPGRQQMIAEHLAGQLPVLSQFEVPVSRTTMEKIKASLTWSKPPPGPPVLRAQIPSMDALWGYYYATGQSWALERIIGILPWSGNHDDATRLTLGMTAKYALATNAMHDAQILAALRAAKPRAVAEAQAPLDEIIHAAETAQIGDIRREAAASLDDLNRRGPASKRKYGLIGQIGQGALSLGCIAAAVTGQVYLGAPCVLGGAASSAVLTYINRP